MINLFNFIKNHKVITGIILILILFLVLRAILLQKPNTELTYTVKQEDLVDTVEVSGSYTTASQIPINSPTNGIISKLYVSNGDQVKKNSPLFYVESVATVDQQKAAYAAYMAANSALQTDNATLYSLQSSMFGAWKKYTDLSTSGPYQNGDGSPNNTNRTAPEFTTVQDNWLSAEALYKNQQNIIAKDQAVVSSTKQSYDETQNVTVVAPADGTIANLLNNIDDQVNVNEPVLLVTNLADPYVEANISEDYAARVQAGQKVYIVFDSLKNKTYSGTVERVDSVGTNNAGIVTYTARITMDELPTLIKPNMTSLITIETLRKNSVIDVPNSAIFNKNGINYVQLASSHKLIPVQLGTQGIAKTEVLKGLQPGDIVVANPEQT